MEDPENMAGAGNSTGRRMVDSNKVPKVVGVLHGGFSGEREISQRTGHAVLEALGKRGYEAVSIPVERGNAWISRIQDVDTVFVALHGKYGEDGSVQGILEMLGVPYTGSGVLASALAMNKPMAKRIWQSHHLPTPRWEIIDDKENPGLAHLSYPVVVKPIAEGSSLGVSIVERGAQLTGAVKEALLYDTACLVEEYIDGKEVTIGVLGNEPLGAMEVVAKGGFHSYEVKYTAGLEEFLMPARIPEETYKLAVTYAWRAHSTLGCRGYSRVDTRVATDGQIYLIELNSLPGLTELSYLPRIAAHRGLNYEDLIESILLETTNANVRRNGDSK